MIILLNVFSKNSYNNQKNKNKPSKEHHQKQNNRQQ